MRMFVFAHQIARKIVRILRREAFEPFELQLDELTAEFDLRRAARRKNKVAHMPTSLQHRGDELRRVKFALRWRHLCWGYLRRGSHNLLTRSPEGRVRV